MPKRILRASLILPLITLVAVGAISGLGIAQLIKQHERALIFETEQRLGTTLGIMSEHLDQSFRALDTLVTSVVSAKAASGSTLDITDFITETHTILKRSIDHLPQFKTYVLISDNGIIISSNNINLIGLDVSDRDYFRTHRAEPTNGYLDKPIISRRTGRRVVPLSWAITNADGALIGVLAVNFSAKYFDGIAANLTEAYSDASISIAYSDKTIFANSNGDYSASLDPYSGQNPVTAMRTSNDLPLQLVAQVPRAAVLAVSGNKTSVIWVAYTLTMIFLTIMVLGMGRALYITRLARDRARETETRQTQMFSMISHEIKTPLTGMLGLSDLLLKQELTEQQRDYVQSIARAGKDMRVIVNDVLDLGKLERGQLRLQPTISDVSSIVRDAADLYASQASQNNTSIAVDIPDDLPTLYIDGHRLAQIVRNFVSNATKFTTDGEIRITVSHGRDLNTSFADDKGEELPALTIRVSDTGTGIPEDKQRYVFERYSQFHVQQEEGPDGTGLGLAICKQLTEAMGGTIGFTSTSGKGTTFWIKIPAPESSRIYSSINDISEVVSEQALNLLVVDDNSLNRKMASAYLENLGYRADTAENGEVAVERAQAVHYDAILLDINMPGMSGWDVADKLKSIPATADVPLIALTASNLDTIEEKLSTHHFTGYLEKPVNWKQLVDMLNALPVRDRTDVVDDDPMLMTSIDPAANPTTPADPLTLWREAMEMPLIDTAIQQELRDAIGDAATDKLTARFVERLDNFALLARNQLTADAGEEWETACHDMKGMSGSLGFARLAALSAVMHDHGWPLTAGADSNDHDPETMLEQLLTTISDTMAALNTPSESKRALP